MIVDFKIFEGFGDISGNMKEPFIITKIPKRLNVTLDDRIIFSNVNRINFEETTKYQNISFKPNGLWYGFGDIWLKFIKTTNMNKKYTKIHKIEITDKVLLLKNREDMINFSLKFGNVFRFPKLHQIEQGSISTINWDKVSKLYSGIEIRNPYDFETNVNNLEIHLTWLNGWDISSGCIWSKDGIEYIKNIY